MANLLPQNKKKEIRKKYRLRVIVVSLFMSGMVLVSAFILLCSLYTVLCSRFSGLDQMHAASVVEKEDTAKLEEHMNNTSAKLKLLQHDDLSLKIPYGIFRSVIDIKSKEISLTEISYSNDQINVTGFAPLRNDLQDFIIAIGKHDLFLQVDYPFSNITQKEDIDFSLNISLAKDDEK